MTIARKLGLGFGTLTALLMLSTMTMLLHLRAVEASFVGQPSEQAMLQELATVERLQMVLFVVGIFVAVVTGVSVGRAVLKGEDALRHSREHLRVTLASIADAVISTDKRGRISYLNQAAEDLTGWTDGEAVGKALEDVFRTVNGPSGQSMENSALKAMREGTSDWQPNHTFLRARDGKEQPIGVRVSPLRNAQGEVTGIVVVFRDITERQESETAVKVSELRYRRLFESAKDGILILDAESARVTDANPFIAEILGYSQGELLGKELWQIGLFKDIDESKAAIKDLQAKKFIRYEDMPLQTKAGKRVDVEFVSNVYEEGEQCVIQCNIRDITERKRLDNELRQYAAELTESDRRKNEFLAMLAHELRNPLAPIRNALEILRLTGGDEQAVAQASAMMERQVGQMVRLVDDLLDVSRISQGRIDLRKGRVELASSVHHAVEAAHSLYKGTDHQLIVSLPPQPIYLDADPTRLAQVVGNLLNNAFKFTDRPGRIDLSVAQEGDQAVIRVRDSGIGIAADQLPQVFDMFRQIDTSLERTGSGLGIGLTLVKNLVELHGGSVEAHSAGIGRGSEFAVRLPVAAGAPESPVQATPGASRSPRAHRILVVDDNPDSASSLAMLLDLSGHATQTAFDGLEAIEAAERFRPQVLLLDIGLPKLNGYEVCRRIRHEVWGAAMVIIALTGWGQEEDQSKSNEAGFDEHLVKPVDHAVLARLLDELVPEDPMPGEKVTP